MRRSALGVRDVEAGDPGFSVRGDPFAHVGDVADERRGFEKSVGDERGGFLPAPRQEQVLDLRGFSFVAEASEDVVVEVASLGSDAADVQGDHRSGGVTDPWGIVGSVADRSVDGRDDLERLSARVA